MQELNTINIPAYQRKRSIAAKARKKPDYLKTIKVPKKVRSRTLKSRTKTTNLNNENYSPLLDIPLKSINDGNDNFFTDVVIPDFTKTHSHTSREMKACGICEGYFEKIEVAIIKVTSAIRKGDILIFEKQDGLFEQEINSMQINHKDVQLAVTGSEIGMKVWQKPTVGGPVYKIVNY